VTVGAFVDDPFLRMDRNTPQDGTSLRSSLDRRAEYFSSPKPGGEFDNAGRWAMIASQTSRVSLRYFAATSRNAPMTSRSMHLGYATMLGLILCGSAAKAQPEEQVRREAIHAEETARANERAANAIVSASDAMQSAAKAMKSAAKASEKATQAAQDRRREAAEKVQPTPEGDYEIGFYRDSGNDALRFFAVTIDSDPNRPVSSFDSALNAGQAMFDAGSTLADPGVFKSVYLDEGDTLVMGVCRNGQPINTWLAVRRMREHGRFEVWRVIPRTESMKAGGSVTLPQVVIQGAALWFRVYLLGDREGEVRFAFLPDGAPNLESFRLVGKYDREPIKAADEKFSYYAVQVEGAFDSFTVEEAERMGREAVQRHGTSLARPGKMQSPRKLVPDQQNMGRERYLVLVAYDAARNRSEAIPVMFGGTDDCLLTLDSSNNRALLTPYSEKQLGGFQIPFSFSVNSGFELGYTVDFPR
jgi:hypothetical protein